MPYAKELNRIALIKKKLNHSKESARTKIHKIKKSKNINVKNVDQFINKPNDSHRNDNSNLIL